MLSLWDGKDVLSTLTTPVTRRPPRVPGVLGVGIFRLASDTIRTFISQSSASAMPEKPQIPADSKGFSTMNRMRFLQWAVGDSHFTIWFEISLH
jgi:hypothetical protein